MNLTIARLAWQAVCGRRRFWAMLIIPVVVVGLAALVTAMTGDSDTGMSVVHTLGFITALPLVALLVTTSVLGPEIDDGSVVYLLSKPIKREVVAISKFLTAWAATGLFGVLPVALAALIVDFSHPVKALAFLVAGIAVAAAYCGLFLALSTLTRHAVVLGLLYVFVWEATMSTLLERIRFFSVRAWGYAILALIDKPLSPTSTLSVSYALIACAVVVVLSLFIAGQRLRGLSVKGEE